MIRLCVVGDKTPHYPPHDTLEASIAHASDALKMHVSATWIPTISLENRDNTGLLQSADGFWIAPGSPYQSLHGAMRAIRYARENDVPLLGTCGGCQHVVIEYARNVLGVTDAAHAEYDPYASRLFVTPLSCSLVGQKMDVTLSSGSLAARSYAAETTWEQYYCNFGVNPEFDDALDGGGLKIVGRDRDNESRIFELADHSFFMATLFVPNLRSSAAQPHPLITAWLIAAAALSDSSGRS